MGKWGIIDRSPELRGAAASATKATGFAQRSKTMRLHSAVIGGLVGLLVAGVSHAGYGPRVGQRHPDFTLPDVASGRPVSLSEFRGKKVLLFHFASW